MFYRSPTDLFEDRNDSDGNIRKHEYRESEGIKYLSRGTAIDLLPLGNGRYKTHYKERSVKTDDRVHNTDKRTRHE